MNDPLKEEESIKNHIFGKNTHNKDQEDSNNYATSKKRAKIALNDFVKIYALIIISLIIISQFKDYSLIDYRIWMIYGVAVSLIYYYKSLVQDNGRKGVEGIQILDKSGNAATTKQIIIRSFLMSLILNPFFTFLRQTTVENYPNIVVLWLIFLISDIYILQKNNEEHSLIDILTGTKTLDMESTNLETYRKDIEKTKKQEIEIEKQNKRIENEIEKARKEKLKKDPNCIYPKLSERVYAWITDNLIISLLTISVVVILGKMQTNLASNDILSQTTITLASVILPGWIALNWIVLVIYESIKVKYTCDNKLPDDPDYKEITDNSLRVIMENNKQMTWGISIKRAFLKSLEGNAFFYTFFIFSFLALINSVYMWILMIWLIFMWTNLAAISNDPKRRAYYDKIAGTVVVKRVLTKNEEQSIIDKYTRQKDRTEFVSHH